MLEKPHAKVRRAACDSRVAVWPPLVYVFETSYVVGVIFTT